MQTNVKPAIISGFSFGYEGLKITYTLNYLGFILHLDPKATCEAFKECGFIQDWTIDKNLEPVILFEVLNDPIGYGYELWCHFIKSFPITIDLLQSVLERKGEQEINQWYYATIQRLLAINAA